MVEFGWEAEVRRADVFEDDVKAQTVFHDLGVEAGDLDHGCFAVEVAAAEIVLEDVWGDYRFGWGHFIAVLCIGWEEL